MGLGLRPMFHQGSSHLHSLILNGASRGDLLYSQRKNIKFYCWLISDYAKLKPLVR